MNVSRWCTRIIRWCFYLLFILVPLVLTSVNYELFEFNKMMVTYALAVIIAAAWAVQMIHEREVRIAKTPLDIPIALFVISQLTASIFSIDRHISWFGYYSRFNGGMWSVITYVVLYYAFVSTMIKQSAGPEEVVSKSSKKTTLTTTLSSVTSDVLPFLRVLLSTAAVVALYGVAERLGVDKKLWVQDVQNRVFSSLGQPNWLAAYLVALMPVSIVFALQASMSKLKAQNNVKTQTPKRLKFGFDLSFEFWIWSLISILFFVVLLFTRSRSGLAAFAVSDIILWILIAVKAKKIRLILPTVAILHIAFAIIIFINGSNVTQIDKYFTFGGIKEVITRKHTVTPVPAAYTGPALEVGGTESGTIRKYVWQAASAAWRSTTKTFLIGTGTETFAYDFYRFRPAGHNMTSEWDFLYNKAHNEYLNYLATTGIFGLGSYLLFIAAFIWWSTKQFLISNSLISKEAPNSKPQLGQLDQLEIRSICIALFAGWVSILITNFFGFSVVIMQIFLFLFPAIVFVLIADEGEKFYTKKINFTISSTILMTGPVILATILLGSLFTRWYADTLYASSYRLARSGQYAQAQQLINKAANLNPGEPVYRDEMATTLTALAVSAFDGQQATVGGQLSNRAFIENTNALKVSPENVNFWKTRTKLYYSLSQYDQRLNSEAISALTQAMTLSPNDPKIYYNLAILYGRQAENDKAVDFLKKAIALKPDYHDAFYALYVFNLELKKTDAARLVLQQYLNTVNPNDKQFLDLLGKAK